MTFYKKTIIFSLAISILPLLVIGVFIFYEEKAGIEKDAINKIAVIGDLKVRQLDEYFAGKKKAADFYRHRYVITSMLPALKSPAGHVNAKKTLDENQESFLKNFGFESVVIADTDGRVLYAFPEAAAPWKVGEMAADITSGMSKDDPGRVYLGDVYKSRRREGYGMRVYSSIYEEKDDKKETLGIAVLAFDMNNIFKFIQDTKGMGRTGETLLGKLHPSSAEDIQAGKKDGYALFLNILRFDPGAALLRKTYIGDGHSLPIQNAVMGKAGGGVSVDYRGRRVIAAWWFIPSLGWGLVAKVDADEVFYPVIALMARLAATIAVAIIIIAIFGFYNARRVKRSLDMLKDCAEEVGRGDLNCRVNSKANDEIGQISRFFDRMVGNLQHTTASLDSLNKEMAERKKTESRLLEKMKELEVFNKAAVDRELKMVELKQKICELEEKTKK